ncbi:hypothetical protein L1887_55244 [Cichorium endivia]|nr:hypothetical protein L1887_55244 [Cichorium endivia]
MAATRAALSSATKRPSASLMLAATSARCVRPQLRLLATHAAPATAASSKKPCADYISLSHPDGDASRGSKIADTLDRFSHSVLATYSRPQLIFTRGNGLDLYAAADPNTNQGHNERKYLDFSSGIAVNSLGHADPKIAEIAAEQSAKLVHASNLYHNEWSGELADRMGQPHPPARRSWLCKGFQAYIAGHRRPQGLPRQLRDRGERGGAQVRTQGSQVAPDQGAVRTRRAWRPLRRSSATCARARTTTWRASRVWSTRRRRGVIVEPVQGEGGIFPASIEFLTALRKRCDEVGAMLIYDEIQCGLFRAGTLWCHSEYPTSAHPDMVTMAKPLANGFPIGAVLMRDSVAQLIAAGEQGAGRLDEGELACAARSAARARGHVPGRAARRCGGGQPSPRGKGLIVGCEHQDPAHAGKVVQLARQRGTAHPHRRHRHDSYPAEPDGDARTGGQGGGPLSSHVCSSWRDEMQRSTSTRVSSSKQQQIRAFSHLDSHLGCGCGAAAQTALLSVCVAVGGAYRSRCTGRAVQPLPDPLTGHAHADESRAGVRAAEPDAAAARASHLRSQSASNDSLAVPSLIDEIAAFDYMCLVGWLLLDGFDVVWVGAAGRVSDLVHGSSW